MVSHDVVSHTGSSSRLVNFKTSIFGDIIQGRILIGGANTDRVSEGHCEWEGDVPPPAWSAKLELSPFYKVNGKLKGGPLQHYKNT